jgi:DNA topoisomerase-1
MLDGIHVLAGDCTTIDRGDDSQERRGDVVAIVKPDNTVLVHDADGYQPVAWLTRPESVTVEDGTITARDGDRLLRVVTHEERGRASYPASRAGEPIGDCPGDEAGCSGTLVRGGGAVTCTDCDRRHGVPGDAAIVGGRCGDCGLPTMRVERGKALEVCLDRACDPILDRVREHFDREWDCSQCGADLRILSRGGIIVGCERYPDCEVGFGLPNGVVVDECDCGLPVFETARGRRCLNSTCEEFGVSEIRA